MSIIAGGVGYGNTLLGGTYEAGTDSTSFAVPNGNAIAAVMSGDTMQNIVARSSGSFSIEGNVLGAVVAYTNQEIASLSGAERAAANDLSEPETIDVHADGLVSGSMGVYLGNGRTRFPYAGIPPGSVSVVVLDDGTELPVLLANDDGVQVSGNYGGRTASIGRAVSCRVTLPKPFRHTQDGAALVGESGSIVRVDVQCEDTASITIETATENIPTRTSRKVFPSREPRQRAVSGSVGAIHTTTISLADTSAGPVHISGVEMNINPSRGSR